MLLGNHYTFATIFGIRDDFEYEEGVELNYKGD